MVRGFVLCLLLAGAIRAETLEEAVRSLAKKMSTRLTPAEAPKVVARSLSPMSANDTQKVRAMFERGLHHPAPRTAHPVEVTLTIAENVRGYLLVAEMSRNGERVVEMAPYRPSKVTHSTAVVLEKRLLWEQQQPMLDIAVKGDTMEVRELNEVVSYTRTGNGWERSASRPSDNFVPSRDPRGRLTPVTLTPGRNTFELNDRPPFFTSAALNEPGGAVTLAAETDGVTRLYDASQKTIGAIQGWGSDIVTPESGCAAAKYVLVTSPRDRDEKDTLTAFELIEHKAVQVSDPVEFPGPVTALWPQEGSVIAIARDLSTGWYAAYLVTIDCGA